MTKANIIADSISPDGIRLTTMHLRYPRFIHSEFMTHRVFSRNARSSRAVPTATLMSEDPFVPQFGLNRPGMQATDMLSPEDQAMAEKTWLDLVDITRERVKRLQELGVHKQWANRPLEWFGWIDVLVTSTDWANFFALRMHAAAQPELQALAEEMWAEYELNDPVPLQPGEWHMPYILPEEVATNDLQLLLKLSTARCARLSYKPFDGEANHEAEIARYVKLVEERPVHASPAEHQATPDINNAIRPGGELWSRPEMHANFRGWIQHRKMLPYEQVRD